MSFRGRHCFSIAFIVVLIVKASVHGQTAPGFYALSEKFETSGGRSSLVGYAFRTNQTTPAQIQIFLGKRRDSGGTLIATLNANLPRPDVKAYFGLRTDRVGFRWLVPPNLENSGRKIFVYRARSYELIRSPMANADGSLTLSSIAKPQGTLETISTDGTEQFAQGWAYFADSTPESVRVDLYADGLPGQGGVFVSSAHIGIPRPDVAANLGFPHDRLGFSIPLPARFRNSGRKLFAFAITPAGTVLPLGHGASGSTTPLSVPFERLLADSAQPSRILSWSPMIASPRRIRALSVAPWVQPETLVDETLGQQGTDGFWLISTSMETAQFSPVRPGRFMDALSPVDPIVRVQASPEASGRYSLRMILDKSSGRTVEGIATDATFLFGSIIDSFDLNPPGGTKPKVGENVFVDLTYRVNRLQTTDVAGIDPPRVRLSVGVTSRFSAQSGGLQTNDVQYTEVNLERTGSFDLCPTQAPAYRYLNLPPGVLSNDPDPDGIYDMRHSWGLIGYGVPYGDSTSTHGELVYYDRKAIRNWVTETRLDDGWIRLRIPVSYLISRYSWSRMPANWESVEIGGIYIGAEIWSKGLIDFEIRDYQSFAAN